MHRYALALALLGVAFRAGDAAAQSEPVQPVEIVAPLPVPVSGLLEVMGYVNVDGSQVDVVNTVDIDGTVAVSNSVLSVQDDPLEKYQRTLSLQENSPGESGQIQLLFEVPEGRTLRAEHIYLTVEGLTPSARDTMFVRALLDGEFDGDPFTHVLLLELTKGVQATVDTYVGHGNVTVYADGGENEGLQFTVAQVGATQFEVTATVTGYLLAPGACRIPPCL